MQPKNPNNALSNSHVCVVGMSECGKTSATKKLFIKRGDQVVIFDPYGDYEGKLAGQAVRTFTRVADLGKALFAARKRSDGFKFAYHPSARRHRPIWMPVSAGVGGRRRQAPQAVKSVAGRSGRAQPKCRPC